LHSSFAKLDALPSATPEYDFGRDLNEDYALPPGRYFLVPSKKNFLPIKKTEDQRMSASSAGEIFKLPITILDSSGH
jgi:hypothetical protein